MIIKSFSITFIILCFVLTILFNSNLNSFLDIPSLWFVVVPILFLSFLGNKGSGSMRNPIKGRAISWFELIGYVSVFLGVIGSHMGMINLYENFGDKSSIGPAFATLILTSFYGILIFLFFFLMGQYKLKKVAIYFVIGQTVILINNMLTLSFGF